MPHPIVHAEIRSATPTRPGPSSASCSAGPTQPRAPCPGYTFVDTGVPDALYTAISPLQGDGDLVTFFVGVEDIEAAIADAVRPWRPGRAGAVSVPGVQFGLIADPQGHVVGLAQQVQP